MPFIIILYKIFGQQNNLLEGTTKDVSHFNRHSIETGSVRLSQLPFELRTFWNLLLN